MSQYFAWDYTGAPFQLFGPAHIAALLALVLIGYGLMQFKKADEATRWKVGRMASDLRTARIDNAVFSMGNEEFRSRAI